MRNRAGTGSRRPTADRLESQPVRGCIPVIQRDEVRERSAPDRTVVPAWPTDHHMPGQEPIRRYTNGFADQRLTAV